MIDFENSMVSACERIYPLVPKKGCLFHLTKNIYRKVQQSGLAQEYINNEQFRNNRMIGALSFVLITDTVHAFTELSSHVSDQEQVILDYFETYYERELRHDRRLNPRYPNTFWNVNTRVQHHLPRTNNHLEEWHN